MKRLFTIDDFMVAFIAALGYGFGENIAYLLGWPQPACIAACFVLGIVLEELISAIVFSKAVQKKPINRVITFVVIFLIIVTAQCISVRWMGVSMLAYMIEESAFVIGLPVIGFVINLLLRAYHIRKI
jgi:para-nitrobenzyl esterase